MTVPEQRTACTLCWLGGSPCREHATPTPRPAKPPAEVEHSYSGPLGDDPYANKALERLAGEVAATPEGARNHTLNVNALRAYRVADARHVDRQIVTDAMEDAARACGLPSNEIEATLKSAQAGADKHGPADIDDTWAPGNGNTDAGHLDLIDNGPPALAARLLTRTALRNLPDPEPLIDNTLDQGTVALLYGKWGTCKSFIAYDWAASVATARAWQGRATRKRRALYVAAEGAYGFKARAAAWEAGWHTTIDDDNLELLPLPINLTRPADVRELGALIKWGGYGFIVLDTLARCMVGADENSAKDCGEVVDSLTRLREATPDGRGVVLGVHHTGKDGKTFRGSSVFEAGADTVYAVNADCGMISLEREKRKDGPEADHHELRLELIEGTGSGVISIHRLGGQTDRADRLMSTFVHHFGQTGATKADLRAVADMPSATFHRAVNDLLKQGALANTGTEKRPFLKVASE
ncbi:AAA family ATPase [Mycobacterium colombiense]|uniref:DnaB domain-containing protein helicase domain-containing protein n=1 Tax=Mycobacterium colombiense CECT 3035 TaxID=1041522 RepID=J4SDH1_9MYCO|nr:AAA family ATPase [Mycobacterium colombiense]EJO86755.1 DnaB domain-containing protein helicase domain-containing protein [Mycobacterium colombiense CECT 3035]